MKVIPATLAMLAYTGLLDHAEATEFLSLWGGGEYAVLDDGQPFGIVAIRPQPDIKDCAWGNVWVIPAVRGKWLDASTLKLLADFVFARYSSVAAATDRLTCGRFLRMLGFDLYCQKGGVSYYSLTRESLMSGS